MDPFQRKPSSPRYPAAGSPSSGTLRAAQPSSSSLRAAQPSSATLRAAQRVAPSGQYPLHYTRMREILIGYLSPILVDSVLEKALGTRNLTPAMVSPHALEELTSDIMIGLRLFVSEQDLPRLMLELADLLGEHT